MKDFLRFKKEGEEILEYEIFRFNIDKETIIIYRKRKGNTAYYFQTYKKDFDICTYGRLSDTFLDQEDLFLKVLESDSKDKFEELKNKYFIMKKND